MKKIEWNKVTWYSKLIAVFLFFVVLMTGIYIGSELQRIPVYEVQPTYITHSDNAAIAIGKPCFLTGSELTDKSITDTKGLQCFAYGEGGLHRQAIWIKPNQLPSLSYHGTGFDDDMWPTAHKAHEQELAFLSRNWKTYTSPDKKLSFKYPATEWNITTEPGNLADLAADQPFTISVNSNLREDGVIPFQIEYFPHKKFDSGDKPESLVLNDFPGGSNTLNDKLQFMESFTYHGMPLYAISSLPVIDLGGYPLSTTFYMTAKNSYLKFTYTRDENLEAFIRSINLQ